MAVSRGKMLGHYTRGPGGYRCSCCRDPDTARWRKTVERRELARELAAAASGYDSDEGKRWLELGLAEAEGWPLYDFSDCQHGCNGDCVESGSDQCSFTCHRPDYDPEWKP